MKILCIQPGASNSTSDVHDGYVAALKRLDHEVKVYALDQRIDRAGGWLAWNWRKTRRDDPGVPKPTSVDVLYWAGIWSIEMALRLEPDWIIVMSGMYLLKDTMLLLRKATANKARMALLLTESPYDDRAQAQVASLFDVVFTNERTSLPQLRMANPRTFYLPHAYDPGRHRPDAPMDADVPSHDVLFVGSGFIERQELLAAVDWTGIDLALYGTYTLMGSRSKLRRYVKSDVIPNDQAVKLYRRAKINLNIYRESVGFGRDVPRITSAESLNPRGLELAACGAFQVSSWRAEVPEVFDTAVPTFRTADELSALIRHHLPAYRLRDARAHDARQAVLGHTYDDRAQQLTEVLSGARRVAA